jgi:transcriptional regulator with XRE-family HTH domain
MLASNEMVKATSRGQVSDPVPRNLRVLREGADMSQEALADAAGISRQTISNIERGAGSADLGTLRKLAAALGVSIGTITAENPGYVEAVRAAAKVAGMTAEQRDVFHRELERLRDDYLRRQKK